MNRVLSLSSFFVILFCLIPMGGDRAAFAEKSQHVILLERVEPDFEPRDVLFFTFNPSNEMPAIHQGIALESHAEGSANQARSWFVATRVPIEPDHSQIEYAAIILGHEKQTLLLETRSQSVQSLQQNSLDLERLRAIVLEQQNSIKEWEKQVQVQTSTLRRLGADADTIARVSQVGEVQTEIERMREEGQRLSQDIQRLREFLRNVSRVELPGNLASREIDLTNQLKLLAERTKQAEEQEEQRLARTQLDLEQGMQIIEATKFEDLSRLQSELIRLQKYRLKLESEIPLRG